MGTITERRLKNGEVVYTAQVRIMRDGKKASASSTFDRLSAAEAWIRRKETELKKPGGFEKMERSRTGGATLAEAIDKYTKTSTRQIGKTKRQVLTAIKSFDIAALPCTSVTSQKIVEFAHELLDGGRQPQTVGN